MAKRKGNRRPASVVREQLAREKRRRRTLWTSAIAVVVLIIAGLVGWSVYASQRADSYATPANATADGVPSGSGPVTVDLYEDFMCPVCGQFEKHAGATVDQLVAQNKIRAVYHPIAILDDRSTTRYSTRASAASGCAAADGKFRAYAQALFAQQPAEGSAGLSDDKLVEIGRSIGLGDGFAKCVKDGTHTTWTGHLTDAAARRNVTATPTVLVDGRQVEATAEAITAAVTAAAK